MTYTDERLSKQNRKYTQTQTGGSERTRGDHRPNGLGNHGIKHKEEKLTIHRGRQRHRR